MRGRGGGGRGNLWGGGGGTLGLLGIILFGEVFFSRGVFCLLGSTTNASGSWFISVTRLLSILELMPGVSWASGLTGDDGSVSVSTLSRPR